jgi:hypothetical protein
MPSFAQVLLGLGVTTQLVAVITQMVMSFDKANSSFRDRQNDNLRFATSRSLPAVLRRKLLTYSLQDWNVNLGYDPYEVIKHHRLPRALSNSILTAIYDDLVTESPMLKLVETPVLHEMLRHMKVVVSLQKETLINQNDPCTRVYILRAGSLQASATDKLMQQAAGAAQASRQSHAKLARQSTWKQKMQVRMIERPGDVISPASPFEAAQPLPFQLTSLKRSTLLAIHMQDLLQVLDISSQEQAEAVCKAIARAHREILLSVMPKSKDNPRESHASVRESRYGDPRESVRDVDEKAEFEVGRRRSSLSEGDLGERRLAALEADLDRCISSMAALHSQAKAIPRMVQALSAMYGKPMQPMGAAAMAALKKPGAVGSATATTASSAADDEIDALRKEVSTPPGRAAS